MAQKPNEQRGLGRGLSALLAETGSGFEDRPSETVVPKAADTHLPIEKVHPNPDQPRRSFKSDDLNELTASIREKGIIQPLIVRSDPNKPGEYQIVAGERRWRAAQHAKLHDVPVLIRQLSDTEVLELAIIENIQRADLNSVEEAQGFRQLMDRFGHTQEKLATVLGKSRSHIANLLRLLTLPDEVLRYLREEKLTAGHARALITSKDPSGLARQVIAKDLSVRQTEALAKAPNDAPKKAKARPKAKDADTRALEQDLSANLKMKVTVDHDSSSNNGVVSIRYATLEQLDEICQILSKT